MATKLELEAELEAAKKESAAAKREAAEAKAKAAAVMEREEQRMSRAQESREAEVIHEKYDDDWEEPTLLDTSNIPARDGFTQRWVRTEIGGKPDTANVSRKLNQGWRPRMAESVPRASYVPTIDHDKFGDVVGMEGMILMERPLDLHEAHGRRNRQAAKDQMRAVDESMFKAHSRNSGFGAPERTSNSTVTRGRSPRVAED